MDHISHLWTGAEAYRNQDTDIRAGTSSGWRRKIEALEPYVRRVMRWGVFFALGWAACASFYNVEHLWQKQSQLAVIQTTTIPKLKSFANCEHVRANVSQKLAVQAIVSANSETVPTPSASALPGDCPHPATK